MGRRGNVGHSSSFGKPKYRNATSRSSAGNTQRLGRFQGLGVGENLRLKVRRRYSGWAIVRSAAAEIIDQESHRALTSVLVNPASCMHLSEQGQDTRLNFFIVPGAGVQHVEVARPVEG
jgi:hypothetical protein